jgi:TrkA domain protein
MVNVEEINLPGVGKRHDFTTRSGRKMGVLTHRDGHREIFVYDIKDPDSCSTTITLMDEEAEAMADLLGGSSITRRLEGLHQEIEGLAIDWLKIEPTSPVIGKTIADTHLRSRSGASIAAVLRGGQSIAAPGPDVQLQANDTTVVIGSPEAVKKAAAILLVG